MAIRRTSAEPEKRAKTPDLPTWDVGSYSDAQIADAVDAANALPGSAADPNMVKTDGIFPMLLMPLTASALDFGNVTVAKVRVGDLIASQGWIKRDRLIWHIQNPGQRNDVNSPFVSLPITAEGGVIIDGHHALTATFLLGGGDLQIQVWSVPIGIATGHPR